MIGVSKDVWLCGLGQVADPPCALRGFTVQCSQLSNAVRPLSWEKEMATHSSTRAWKIPWME